MQQALRPEDQTHNLVAVWRQHNCYRPLAEFDLKKGLTTPVFSGPQWSCASGVLAPAVTQQECEVFAGHVAVCVVALGVLTPASVHSF